MDGVLPLSVSQSLEGGGENNYELWIYYHFSGPCQPFFYFKKKKKSGKFFRSFKGGA